MILPNSVSPLRPVIAAFYATSHSALPEWQRHDYAQALRHILGANGNTITSTPTSALDLVIDQRIGVVIVPHAQEMTNAMRCRLRQFLAEEGLEVALVMTFFPQPRLARIDAPLHSLPANEKDNQPEG